MSAFAISDVFTFVGKAFVLYNVVMTVVAGLVAVIQEWKIWKPESLKSLSLIGQVKLLVFNLLWYFICFVGSVAICLKWLATGGRSDIEDDASRLVEHNCARICLGIFIGTVKIEGGENLPKEGEVPAPIYVANHSSQADIAAAYYLERRFKWVAKVSVLYLPGVGPLMWLAGHVLIQRKGKNKTRSSYLFDKCDENVQAGIPMFFFPQGTRQIAERLPFKDGAFIVAQNNKSKIVPISFHIPNDTWNSLYPLSLLWTTYKPAVKMIVHEPIILTGKEDRETLKKTCYEQIYSSLPPIEGAKNK